MINLKARFQMMMGLCMCTFSLLAADVIFVNEGDDLQQAIDAAQPGDILKLRGTFTGSFLITESLTLEGRGKEPAILDGNHSGAVLVIGRLQDSPNEEEFSVTLRNLIIENGLAPNGGGILNQFAKLTLEFVTVRNNQATNSGGGIASALGELVIRHSLIKNNVANNGGGGINNLNNTLTIRNSIIADNVVQKGSGGGIVANSSVIDLKHTSILRNQALSNLGSVGGGLDNDAGCNTTIRQCIIRNNKANSGAGIYNAATLTVKNSLISKNQALPTQGIIKLQARGGGLFNASSGNATLINSLVRLNEAGTSQNPGNGGGIFNNNGGISLERTRVRKNFPNDIVPPPVG